MATATAVSRHLVQLASADPEGEGMTSLRLHKLLYYCQGWFLAWYGRPLFPERIEAWKYGPVVPDVYARPWGKGREVMTEVPADGEMSEHEREAVEQVWREYARFSALGLRDKTHTERPWLAHYTPDEHARCDNVIPTADLLDHFGRQFSHDTGEEAGAMGRFEEALAGGKTITHDQLLAELGR